jgi:hypothetical protein
MHHNLLLEFLNTLLWATCTIMSTAIKRKRSFLRHQLNTTRSEKVVAADGPYKYDDPGKYLDNFCLLELLSCDESLRVKLSINVPPQSETFSPAIKTTHSQRVSFSESVLQHSTSSGEKKERPGTRKNRPQTQKWDESIPWSEKCQMLVQNSNCSDNTGSLRSKRRLNQGFHRDTI